MEANIDYLNAGWARKRQPWRCLVCDKWHPGSDPHIPMTCLDCRVEGLGHPDDHAICRDCIKVGWEYAE